MRVLPIADYYKYSPVQKHKLNTNRSNINFKGFEHTQNNKFSLSNLNPVNHFISKLFERSLIASRKRIQPPIEGLKDYTKEITLQSTPKQKTYAWDINKNNRKKYAIVLHGTSQNISNLQTLYRAIIENTDYAVLAPEYRSFGKNKPTTLSERTFLEDTSAALTYLKNKRGIQAQNISVIGHSFGGFAASQLVKYNNNLESLILVSSIDSLEHESVNTKRALRNKVPPVINFLFKNFSFLRKPLVQIFRTNDCLENINIPVSIIHSKNDLLIKPSSSENLAKKCKNLKDLIIIDTGGHGLESKKIKEIVSVLSR